MDKNKNKRMSLDPSKNKSQYSFMRKQNATQLQMSSGAHHQQSQSSLSNQQIYESEDLEKIFTAISQGKEYIAVQDLYSILQAEGYQDCLYSAVEMVALVDENRKGFVGKKEFFRFFSNKIYDDEEKIPPLNQEMKENRKWVKAIQENWEDMKQLGDKEYCEWVAGKIKQHQKSKKHH